MFADNSKSYEKSNKHPSVSLNSFSKSYMKAMLNSGESIAKRKEKGQELLDYLCDKFHIDRLPLIVTASPRPKRVRGNTTSERHGFYTHIGSKGLSITIYNTTAVKQQVVAIKTFVETLLHEFVHHYDYNVLKLDKSLHCSGFYHRIGDLQAKLTA